MRMRDRVESDDLRLVIKTIDDILKTGRLQGQFRDGRRSSRLTPADRAYFIRMRQLFTDELAQRSR